MLGDARVLEKKEEKMGSVSITSQQRFNASKREKKYCVVWCGVIST